MPDALSFLIVDTYYPRFLSTLYSSTPGLANMDYASQKGHIMAQCFGTADFYSLNLNKMGCYADEVIANNNALQKQWLREHSSYLSFFMRRFTGTDRSIFGHDNTLPVLRAQIKKKRPDILYMQDLSFCPPDFLSEMKRYVKLIVGQIACPLPPIDYLKPYDLILTSFPHYVNRFRDMGINSEYFKIAFDSSVLKRVETQERKYTCTFVGGISPAHRQGTELLEALAENVEIAFFGYGAETLNRESPILPRHHGEVWGLDMYRALLSSTITVNRHIDVSENYANNMRLYEATGCGALLITDYKDNLNELFEVGKEVIVYKDIRELIELVAYYSEHETERAEIALAGQNRTLKEHTYHNRMIDLIQIINKYI